MLPRTQLLTLLTASLLAVHSIEFPLSRNAALLSGGLRDNSSIVFQANSDDKYTLQGIVINSVTSESIRGALVQVDFNGQSSRLTGSAGEFHFDGLPAGEGTITVRKPGFFSEEEVPAPEPHQATVTTGPNSPPVVLKLVPEGVICGRISVEDGEPLQGLQVSLLVQNLQDGRKTWEQRPSTATDEDGNFRFAELLPGNYFLSAGPSRNPVTFPAKLSQPGAQGIPVVYYPAAADLVAAAPISVTPGKKAEVNLALSPQPFYRVSGKITGYVPNQSVTLRLSNSAGIPMTYTVRFDSTSGSFRIPWVSAGTYILHADSPDGHGGSLTGTLPLAVSADVSGAHLTLLPAVTIPVRMSVISSRTSTERFWEQGNYFPASVQLISHNGGLAELRYKSQQVGETGAASLELQNIPPGAYGVEVNPNGPLYVQSATSGMRDLLDSDLSIAPGTLPQPIEITLRDDVASLAGTVSLGNQFLSATILAFSEHASVPARIQPTDPGGGFLLPFLPPGVYKILAVDSADRLEYTNPEALKKYLWKARAIPLSPGQSAKVDLELVKVEE